MFFVHYSVGRPSRSIHKLSSSIGAKRKPLTAEDVVPQIIRPFERCKHARARMLYQRGRQFLNYGPLAAPHAVHVTTGVGL